MNEEIKEEIKIEEPIAPIIPEAAPAEDPIETESAPSEIPAEAEVTS